MSKTKFSVALAALVSIAGCTGSTNPETATVFDNIANLNSGEYDRQIASNKSQADAILRNNQASQGRINSLDAQKNANSREIASLRSQIASAQNAAASARTKAAGDPAKLARVSALESQLSSVSNEVNSGRADPGVASAELRRIRSALQSI